MADYEITPTPLAKKLDFARESCRVAKYHLDHATTPGMKNYWMRIWQGAKVTLQNLQDQFNRENPSVG